MSYGFYDITLYRHSSEKKGFAIRNNLVSSLYIDFLYGYKPKNTTRISVDIGNEDCVKGYCGSILLAEVAFNETEYWLRGPESQNKIMLDTIHRIAILCAEKYGWDKGVFDLAHSKVLESRFIYKKDLKKKLSRDRKHQASLLLEKNGNSATISVNFYNSKGEFLKSVELLKSFDHEMFYGRLIGNNKWFNNLEFGMQAKNEELVIKAALDKNDAETVISPIIKTKEELEGYLRRITYREFDDESEYIKWSNQ